MTTSVRVFVICFLCLSGSLPAFGQSAFSGKGENRIKTAWAYYGRGNGISLMYDHGFNDWLSVGAGVEFYFEERERETSFFGIVDFHLQKALKLPERLDVYPGTEIGLFDRKDNQGFFRRRFVYYPYIGLSWAFTEEFGLFTEIGERGTLGVYFNF